MDVPWAKRISRQLDDPKRGVAQGDIYQMIACGQLYDSADLLLIYPHHGDVGAEAGAFAAHRITGTSRRLRAATIDLAGGCRADLARFAGGEDGPVGAG